MIPSGNASTPITTPAVITAARSITFCSSRTLPGHGYLLNISIASREIPLAVVCLTFELTVLDKTKPGGSTRGHMYACLGDDQWVVYDYRPTGSAAGPCEFLGTRQGGGLLVPRAALLR